MKKSAEQSTPAYLYHAPNRSPTQAQAAGVQSLCAIKIKKINMEPKLFFPGIGLIDIDPSNLLHLVKEPSNNRRVTVSKSKEHARSESVIAVDPNNSKRIIGASKKFARLSNYEFTVSTYFSNNGGIKWHESQPLKLNGTFNGRPFNWGGLTDPVVMWDLFGNCYLVVIPFDKSDNPNDYVDSTWGICIYKSEDGGATWGDPVIIHEGFKEDGEKPTTTDDKPWAAADNSNKSKFKGNLYTCWLEIKRVNYAVDTPTYSQYNMLWFGVSKDQGKSWETRIIAVNGEDSSYPFSEISIGKNGTVYIIYQKNDEILLLKSKDGGYTFSQPISVAKGITVLPINNLDNSGWHKFPNGKFRVITLPTCCVIGDNTIIVAWADGRNDNSQIFYAKSIDGGNSWDNGDDNSGMPLLSNNFTNSYTYQFHPQLMNMPNGMIGCAIYEYNYSIKFQLMPNGEFKMTYTPLISVTLYTSKDYGENFEEKTVITDQPWNPNIEAPLAHGDKKTTFIGEYFGIDANKYGFYLLWTDTRTGSQELFFSKALVKNKYELLLNDSISTGIKFPLGLRHSEEDNSDVEPGLTISIKFSDLINLLGNISPDERQEVIFELQRINKNI